MFDQSICQGSRSPSPPRGGRCIQAQDRDQNVTRSASGRLDFRPPREGVFTMYRHAPRMTALAAAGAILATACFGGTPPAASPAPAGGGAQVSTGSDVKATLSGDPGSGTKNVTI